VAVTGTPGIDDPQAKAQAQALLSEGTRLYGEGDVAGALEKFQGGLCCIS